MFWLLERVLPESAAAEPQAVRRRYDPGRPDLRDVLDHQHGWEPAGGALSDRIGRKSVVIFGLVSSAVITLILGFAERFSVFVAAVLVVGVFASVGNPARQAMVADLLKDSKRAEGFGILRVAFNLSVTIGPAIGGLLAARSYLLLFITDAVISTLTAGIIVLALPETRPTLAQGGRKESMGQTFAGYGRVLRDSLFMAFSGMCVWMTMVYIQMNSTLGVYLRDTHGIAPQGYGYILSLNAALVVLFQFYVTRRIQPVPQFLAMAAGTVLYAFGFALYGLFLLAMVIITIGEMMVAPVSQALVAKLAPAEMRGRYMAAFGFTWVIPGAIGPLLAGLVMDNADPRLVWYAAGLLGLVAAAGFSALHQRAGERVAPAPERLPGEAAARAS
ncbi:MAG: MFS transporter [Chloroflexota bacterium]